MARDGRRALRATAGSAGDALAAAVAALDAAGCETPRLDAEVLIADALGVDRAALISSPTRGVPTSAARLVGERVRRRVAREPVAYILGRKGFRFIELAVDARVMIPRPETELLVEVALELPRGARVHEVGTGSGAVALALRSERPDLRVSASDASPAAVEVARANARALDIELPLATEPGLPDPPGPPRPACQPADERSSTPPRWDLVIANLPYVAEGEVSALAPEIRAHEPREALVAGPGGLDAIRELAAQAPSGTSLALEHAPNQAQAVRALLHEAQTRRDLAGRERVTIGRAR